MCAPCVAGFLPIKFACAVCEQPVKDGDTCVNCKTVDGLDGLVACFDYKQTPPIARFIQALKYSRAYDLATAMPAVWQKFLPQTKFVNQIFLKDVAVVPLPLHPRRLAERGFNQAELLANSLAEQLKIPIFTKILSRQKVTAQQAKLNRVERAQNMVGAFACVGTQVPKNIIIVDDVFTTGATMKEAAKVLKAGGAGRVWGVALAREY